MKRALFLDRDGVVNRVIFREGKPCSPRKADELEICSGVKSSLLRTRKAGYLNIVVTNQPDIARGIMPSDELEAMHARIRRELAVDDVLACVHDNGDGCGCRKPKPGLLFYAAHKWNVDLNRSFMIGDQSKDCDAGRAAGCKTILIEFSYNQDAESDYRVGNLKAAIDLVICDGDQG